MSNNKIVSDKLSRLLSFLRGCGKRRVGVYLRRSGFTQADLDEGWALLREASDEFWSDGNRRHQPLRLIILRIAFVSVAALGDDQQRGEDQRKIGGLIVRHVSRAAQHICS